MVCSCFVFLAMSMKAQTERNKIEWIEGAWVAEVQNGTFKEVWVKKSENEWSGRGYQFKGIDTVFKEELKLTREEGILVYTAIVGDQAPVSFKNRSRDRQAFVFENLKHDYPQRIMYSFQDSLNLHVKVSGRVKGKKEEEHLKLKKVK